jgi:hypothetical protein
MGKGLRSVRYTMSAHQPLHCQVALTNKPELLMVQRLLQRPYWLAWPQQKMTFLVPFESGLRFSSFGERRIHGFVLLCSRARQVLS